MLHTEFMDAARLQAEFLSSYRIDIVPSQSGGCVIGAVVNIFFLVVAQGRIDVDRGEISGYTAVDVIQKLLFLVIKRRNGIVRYLALLNRTGGRDQHDITVALELFNKIEHSGDIGVDDCLAFELHVQHQHIFRDKYTVLLLVAARIF